MRDHRPFPTYARDGGAGLHRTGALLGGEPLTRTPLEARLRGKPAAKSRVATQMATRGLARVQPGGGGLVCRRARRCEGSDQNVSTTPARIRPGADAATQRRCRGRGDWQAGWARSIVLKNKARTIRRPNWRVFSGCGTWQIGNWANAYRGSGADRRWQLGEPPSVSDQRRGWSNITYPDRATVRIEVPARGGIRRLTL